MRKTSYALWYAVLRFHPFVTKLTSSIQNWSEPTWYKSQLVPKRFFQFIHARSVNTVSDSTMSVQQRTHVGDIDWCFEAIIIRVKFKGWVYFDDAGLLLKVVETQVTVTNNSYSDNLTWTISIHDRLFHSVLNHLNYLVNFVVNSWHHQTLCIYR